MAEAKCFSSGQKQHGVLMESSCYRSTEHVAFIPCASMQHFTKRRFTYASTYDDSPYCYNTKPLSYPRINKLINAFSEPPIGIGYHQLFLPQPSAGPSNHRHTYSTATKLQYFVVRLYLSYIYQVVLLIEAQKRI